MKEIDFLPEWYRSGRRRQISYRTQYIALGGIFVVMMTWNLITGGSISKAAAELSRQKSQETEAERITRQAASIKQQIAELEKKAKVIDRIDSRIDVSSVLAELSFLVGERIVLSRLELSAERFASRPAGRAGGALPVRAGGGGSSLKKGTWLGDVRFRVVINGIAVNGGDVAELICKLEDSAYFSQVILSFSRNTTVRTQERPADGEFRVTEFEMNCYLANYEQDGADN